MDEIRKKDSDIKRVTITIPEDVHEAGTKKAQDDHRSFSSYVTALIAADAKKEEPQLAEAAK